MTTKQSILSRLSHAVSGSEKEYLTNSQLEEFASFYEDKWDENTSDDVIVNSLVDYFYCDVEFRRCSECGKLMQEGYMICSGEAYYCSDECLHKSMTEEEYESLCDEISTDTCWTQWY